LWNKRHDVFASFTDFPAVFETGKAGQEAREVERYKLDILGVSECRWRGSGKLKLNTG